MKTTSILLAAVAATVAQTSFAFDSSFCPNTITLALSDFRADRNDSLGSHNPNHAAFKIAKKRLAEIKSFMITAPLFKTNEEKKVCQYYTNVASDLKASFSIEYSNATHASVTVNFQIGETNPSSYIMFLTADVSPSHEIQIKSSSYDKKNEVSFLFKEGNYRFAYPMGRAFIETF